MARFYQNIKRSALLTVLVAGVSQLAMAAQENDPNTDDDPIAAHIAHAEERNAEHDDSPRKMDENVQPTEFIKTDHSPDPSYPDLAYDPEAQRIIYGGKTEVKSPPFFANLGRDFYANGELGEGLDLFGKKNRVYPQFTAFGDLRTAVAYNDNQGKDVAQIAARANINLNFSITSTERIHAFFRPIDSGAKFTRFEFGGSDKDPNANPKIETNFNPITLFFEGDMGAILAGLTDDYKPYDLPFTFGRVPLLFQNGVWMEDAIIGGAFAIPAKNSSKYDISNFDITFFVGLDEVTTNAFRNSKGGRDDHDAKMVGVAGFLEFGEGYMETGYAYVHDKDKLDGDFSYHNFTVSFTKRYFGKISNSTRVIANIGQNAGPGFNNTADGVLFLSENSLVTSKPLTVVPYANFWAGFGTTQSLARAGGAGGVLKNTGINFETDGLTGFPKLDDSAINSVGGAIGLENLFALDQQLVVEAAVVIPHSASNRVNKKVQFGVGVRYQKPLSNAVIARFDAMYGNFGGGKTSAGIRMELRRKF